MVYLFIVLISMIVVLSQFQSNIPVDNISQKFTDEHSQFFNWQGLDIHFKDEGNGFPILFLHGTSSSVYAWNELTNLLKANYRIIRADLIGFGVTGPHPQKDYSIEMYLKFIDDFMAFLGVNKFIIAGNSWGGMLAWNYSALYPQKVSGLILINSAGFKMDKVPARFKLVQYCAGRWLLKYSTPKWMVKRGLREVVYSRKLDKKSVERYQLLTLRKGNRQAFIDFIISRQAPKPELLSTILSPTLILWGRLDKLYPLHHAHLFKERIPNAQLNIIENSAHIPMEENPSECSIMIKKFINALQNS